MTWVTYVWGIDNYFRWGGVLWRKSFAPPSVYGLRQPDGMGNFRITKHSC